MNETTLKLSTEEEYKLKQLLAGSIRTLIIGRRTVKIEISRTRDGFTADPVSEPGSPPVGRGATMTEALGDFLIHHQSKLGLTIDLDGSALETEQVRRAGAMAQR